MRDVAPGCLIAGAIASKMLGAVAPTTWARLPAAGRSQNTDLIAARITRAVEPLHAWVALPDYQAYRRRR